MSDPRPYWLLREASKSHGFATVHDPDVSSATEAFDRFERDEPDMAAEILAYGRENLQAIRVVCVYVDGKPRILETPLA